MPQGNKAIHTKQHINRQIRYLGSFTSKELLVVFFVLVIFFTQLGFQLGWISLVPVLLLAKKKREMIAKGNEDLLRDIVARTTYKKSFEDKRHLFKYLMVNHEHGYSENISNTAD